MEKYNIDEEYPDMDWNRSLFEIEKDMTLIDVFVSVDFVKDCCEQDQEQLYRFAKIVNNYTKMKNLE